MHLHSKQWGKTPMDDEKIIGLYFERNEKAIEETDLKYRKYLLSIGYNIIHDSFCCEECLNDTYLSAWNSIPPSRPRVLKAFLAVITRRIAIKRYRGMLKKSTVPSEMTLALSELEHLVSDIGDVHEAFEAENLGQIISSFVHSLNDRRQFIFMGRYYMSDSILSIAKDLNVSRSTVNKELAFIRSSLKEKLESEGYSV